MTTTAPRLSFQWLWLGWLGMIFTTLAIGVIGGIVQGDPAPVVMRWGLSDFGIFAVSLYGLGALLAAVVLLRLLAGRRIEPGALGLRGRLSWRGALLALLAVAAAAVLYELVSAACAEAGIGMYWHPKATHVVLRNRLDLALVAVFAVVVGPLCEELLFRGYLLGALRERGFGFLAAAAISGLAFTSTHVFLGPGAMLFILAWSFLPAALVFRFDSLYPAMLFHGLNNLLAYVLVPVLFS